MIPMNDFVNSPGFRPMLAAKCQDIGKLRYPLLCTPKIDGIRAVTRTKFQFDLMEQGVTVEPQSRFLKPIPNRHIRETIGLCNLLGLDGEIVTFTNGKMDTFFDVSSKVMSEAGKPEFEYMVFDVVEPLNYVERMIQLKDGLIFPDGGCLKKLLPVMIPDEVHLLSYEEAMLQSGFEGVMIRSCSGLYKFGRSTFNQGHLIKLKRFDDAEATVIGFQELMHNENEATVSALGLTERSDHKANKVYGNKLGALIVNGHNNQTFNIGTGFTDTQRIEIWNNQEKYLMQKAKYKYQPHGEKDAPRCPVFLGFRSMLDL